MEAFGIAEMSPEVFGRVNVRGSPIHPNRTQCIAPQKPIIAWGLMLYNMQSHMQIEKQHCLIFTYFDAFDTLKESHNQLNVMSN